VVRVIHGDDDVSSDDDVPLQRWMKARGQSKSTADRPPPVAPTSRPTSSVVAWATVPRGSSGSSSAGDTTVATRAVVAKEAADVAVETEAIEEAAVKKKATEEAAVRKKAIVEAAAKKKVVEEAVTKKASEEAVNKTESGAANAGSGPSPAPSVGVKREVAPSGSTPLVKW
jgi:hypothetical protein